MSHDRIEMQGGGSWFAAGVKVPVKLVHIPLRNYSARIVRAFDVAAINACRRGPSIPGRERLSRIDELQGKDSAHAQQDHTGKHRGVTGAEPRHRQSSSKSRAL
jgi:hypothetical protein